MQICPGEAKEIQHQSEVEEEEAAAVGEVVDLPCLMNQMEAVWLKN
jgi:hypothetical protein